VVVEVEQQPLEDLLAQTQEMVELVQQHILQEVQ
jgi:hypothetical protein